MACMKRSAIFFVMAFCSATVPAQTSDRSTEILKIVANATAEICGDVPTSGWDAGAHAGASLDASLRGSLKTSPMQRWWAALVLAVDPMLARFVLSLQRYVRTRRRVSKTYRRDCSTSSQRPDSPKTKSPSRARRSGQRRPQFHSSRPQRGFRRIW